MTETDRPEQERIRFEKLEQLRASGFDFPNDVKVDTSAATLLNTDVVDAATAPRFTIAGRIVQLRHMGKASFVHILDSSAKIQLYVKKDEIGDASYELFKNFDIGDIIEVKGYLFLTKTGEKTVHASAVRLLVKSLVPLPEKWHGLQDVEARYRYRYVDLIANPEARDIFRKRAQIIRLIRNFFDARKFLEVETPILHYIAGGANARPFSTHYNSLDCDMFLRIALELPLKKLLVGGFDRVYEIGRNFRNEGISRKHNPEFTMLEFYQAFATFEDLMIMHEELYCELAQTVCGSLEVKYGEMTSNFARPWRRISMLDSVYEVGGISREVDLNTIEGIQKAAQTHKVHLAEPKDWGRSLEALWGELVEHKLISPTFITHHPFSISPLSRKNAADSKLTDRFELIICGMESSNAFSELNDAVDQRERFATQAARKAAGDEEAPAVDEDFLRALEYGMPPAAGAGFGIDRLVMLLTNSPSIREVVLFPQLKPL